MIRVCSRFQAGVLGAALSLWGLPATAQIAVDRAEVFFTTRPDAERLGIITLKNEGSQAVQAMLRIEDWDRTEEGTNRWFPVGTVPGACGSYLEVFPASVVLEPGATQAVRISLDSTISLDRECWAGVVVETIESREISGRHAAYVLRTATKVYIRPEGLLPRGEVVAMEIVPADSGVRNSAVGEIELVVENLGGLQIVSRGELQLRRPDNSVVSSLPIPPLYTLPGARSKVRLPLNAIPQGRYVALAILDYGGPELAAGQLEVTVP